MTPTDIQTAALNIRREIGPRADLSIVIALRGDLPIRATVYAFGLAHSSTFHVVADDWESLFAQLRSEWARHKETTRVRQVRKMALEIIRVTAENGECTDAALRMIFHSDDVGQYGADACRDANEIAGNGPFEIVALGGANAVAAE